MIVYLKKNRINEIVENNIKNRNNIENKAKQNIENAQDKYTDYYNQDCLGFFVRFFQMGFFIGFFGFLK